MGTNLRSIPLLLLIAVLFWGCSASDSEGGESTNAAPSPKSGGLFKMSLSDDILSIFPHNLVDAAAFNLMNQVYEGLFELDPETQEVKPKLARSYEVSQDGRVYTITLKEGVYFHDDEVFEGGKGREVKAEDVIFCFTKLCEPSENNALYPYVIDLIKGASDYYRAKLEGSDSPDKPEGLRLINERTLEIELEHPSANFLAILTHPCCWIFPREIYDYGGDINNWCIGTGPFKALTIKMNEVIIFEANKRYHRTDSAGHNLPYLDAIRCNFIEEEDEQLNEFLDGNLDLIFSVPRNRIQQLQADNSPNYRLLTIPGMRIEYYGFQHRSNLFADDRLRKAINYAIDRESLVADVLKGFGEPANYGFVPPATPGYKAEKIDGYSFNPDSAQALLAAAGYPGGDGFPVLSIQINDGNPIALDVAVEVQRMLAENLNITVELSVLPRDKHYEQVELGNVKIWRDGWIADYPDPENFLILFYGKLVPDDTVKASYLNTVRFKNADFDRFFEQSTKERNPGKRMELLYNADSVVVAQAAVAPLYYEHWVWLVNERVENLSVSPMGELDLGTVYFLRDQEEI
jgi:peptide/nickel transport system substrate-binding protein